MPSTEIALSMEKAGPNAGYDEAAKKLMSFKSVVAWILKLNTSEFADYDVDFIASDCISEVSISQKAVHQDHPDRTVNLQGDERVTLMNSESSSINEGKVYYDLRLRARIPGGNGDLCLIVNLEIQNDDNLKYPLVTRGLYYCARMISEQYGTVFTNMDYQKIQKVYSIWICPETDKTKRTGRRSSITHYSVTEKGLLGNSFIKEADYDKMEVVVIKLGGDCEYNESSITGLLSALLSSDMTLERRKEILGSVYGIAMTKEFESEVTEVCNLSRAIEESGIEKGIEKGMFITLFRLINAGKLSVDDAANDANMTVEEFLKMKEEYEK